METQSTVFDDTSKDLLLKMAAEEGLLEEDARQTDSFLENRKRRSFPGWLREQVLEQITYAPRTVLVGDESVVGLKGYLLDEGLLGFVPRPERRASLKTMPRPIIAGLLTARGFQDLGRNPDQAVQAFNRAVTRSREFEQRTGKKLPRLGRPLDSDNIAKQFARNIFQKAQYSEQEYNEAETISRDYKENEPIRDCINEYELLATVAEEQNLLMRTPLLPETTELSIDNLMAPGDHLSPPIKLLRIAAKGLGKLPFRVTLKETLELSRQPATVALRERIGDWLTAWSNTNEQDIRAIHRDINTAYDQLSKLAPLRTVGTLCTWLAVPITVAEAILNFPPIASLTVSTVGLGVDTTMHITEHRYRWAMFGNSPG